MKGIVEIYSNFGTPEEELLLSENNLLVNGAGETICTLLTTPSSLVSGAPGITDTSNFTVQALSLGKSSKAYKNNAHLYPFNVSSYSVPGRELYNYVSFVKNDKIVRAASLKNENIEYSTSSYDPKRDPGIWPNPNDKQVEPNTGTAIDSVSAQSHFMGSSVMQGRAHSYGHNLNRIFSNTNPNLLSYTDGPTTDPGFNGGTSEYWASSNLTVATLSGVNTGPLWGTSSLFVSAAVGTTGQVSGVAASSFRSYFHNNVDHTFSVYINIPETNAASAVKMNLRDNTVTRQGHRGTFILYDADASEYVVPYFDNGTYGTSGYVTHIKGIGGATDWFRLEVALEGLGIGPHTYNGDELQTMVTLEETLGSGGAAMNFWGWQYEEGFGASRYQRVEGVVPEFDEGGIAGDIFLGCYPHTSGTNFSIVSSIEYMADPVNANILVSGVYPNDTSANYFNSSSIRSMDQNGFIRAYSPSSTIAEASPVYPNGINDPASGLIVSANSDFSSTGEVSYFCTISSGDLGLANMYGGLFKLGLWTIDLPATLSSIDVEGNSKHIPNFPLKFSAAYNRIVYKLFAEKSLTSNIAAIKDDGSNAGCFNYSDLTLVWRIQFI